MKNNVLFLSLFVFTLIFHSSLAPEAAAQGAQVLTNINQIERLAPDEAARKIQVRMRGITTFYVQSWGGFFLQDATGGTWARLDAHPDGLRPGMEVEVSGVTDAGAYQPIIADAEVEILGMKGLPEPEPVDMEYIMTGAPDGNWVSVTSIVRRVDFGGEVTRMMIGDSAGVVDVNIAGEPAQALKDIPLIGARMELHGACGANADSNRNFQGMTISVPSPEHIRILDNGYNDPFNAPVFSLQNLRTLLGREYHNRLVQVRGHVSFYWPGTAVVITNGQYSLQADIREYEDADVKKGDMISVAGFLSSNKEPTELEDACVKTLSVSDTRSVEDGIETNEQAPALTRIFDIINLPKEKAALGRPVKVTAVVTYFDIDHYRLVVQDGTAGAFVWPNKRDLGLHVGDLVEVTGETAPGAFVNVIDNASVARIGSGDIPPPRVLTPTELTGGRADSQWVELHGVVNSINSSEEGAVLNVVAPTGEFMVTLNSEKDGADLRGRLVDAAISVRGVCASIWENGRLTGFQMLCPSTNFVNILEPPPEDPFALEMRPVNRILQFVSPSGMRHRVHIRGTLLHQDDDRIFLKGETGNICVLTDQTNRVESGTILDVVGFPMISRAGTCLTHAIFKSAGLKQAVSPERIEVEKILEDGVPIKLVSIEAFLVEKIQQAGSPVMIMQSGGNYFTVNAASPGLADVFDRIKPGSVLGLAGVCVPEFKGIGGARTFSLHLQGPDAVEVLREPSWWTLGRILALLSTMGLVLVAAITWVLLLRHKVREQTQRIREHLENEASIEERYRQLFKQAVDPVCILDSNAVFISLNNSAQRLLGYTGNELAGTSCFEVVDEKDIEKAATIHKRIINGENMPTFTINIRTRDKQLKTVEVNAKLLTHSGNPPMVQLIARDITERLISEERVRESEKSLARSQRIGKVGSWEMDVHTGKVRLSREAARIFNFDPYNEEADREFMKNRVHPDDRERVSRAVQDALNGAGNLNIDHRTLNPDGSERFVHAQAEVEFDSANRPKKLICTLHDISERKNLEARLREAQKLEAIGQLAGGIAHDFNNIITITQGYVDLLLADSNIPESANEALEEIRISVKRMCSLTNQILAFSRKQMMQPILQDINTLIRNMHGRLRPLVGVRHKLSLMLEPDLPSVLSDPELVEQVLFNLAKNAVDAMPDGGVLKIETSSISIDSQSLEKHSERYIGDFVRITVTDTGLGIDAEIMERLFEPFFTTKDVGKGRGLGLSMAYGVVKQHRGWMEVESSVGCGAAFKIFLPIADTRQRRSHGAAAEFVEV